METQITVFNLGNLPTAPVDSFCELQEDFKLYDHDLNLKLQNIILTRGFKYAFLTWKDEEGVLWIIDAHQRKRALVELRERGYEIPPIPYQPIYASSKREAVAEIAALNSVFATVNPDTHLFEMYEIGDVELELFNLDFSAKRLSLLSEEQMDGSVPLDLEDDEYDIPATIQTEIKEGDIIEIGPHRLLCGDSTKPESYVALFGSQMASMVVTDPPYNVAYEGGTKEALTILNDNMSNDAFYTFLSTSFANMATYTHPGAPWYIWHADSEGVNFRNAMVNAGVMLKQCLIWVKNQMVLGRQDYQWKHEPCLYGWKKGAAHPWYTNRKQTTVLEFDKPMRNAEHPTMKPIPLIGYQIQNSSKIGDIVADNFVGSGTTMLASHQLRRVCYAMELSPQYCQVTVNRMRQFDPSVVILLNGVEW